MAELEHHASTDALTGLANRRSFDASFPAMLAAGRSGAALGCIALFDLDRFKWINDRHGHAMGDLVLKQFAAIVG